MSIQRVTTKFSQSEIENSASVQSFSIIEQNTDVILKTKWRILCLCVITEQLWEILSVLEWAVLQCCGLHAFAFCQNQIAIWILQ